MSVRSMAISPKLLAVVILAFRYVKKEVITASQSILVALSLETKQ